MPTVTRRRTPATLALALVGGLLAGALAPAAALASTVDVPAEETTVADTTTPEISATVDADADAADDGSAEAAAPPEESSPTAAPAEGPALPGPVAAASSPVAVSDVLFDWGLNTESSGGAYFGGCNFLSAGTAGDAGGSRIWTQADGLYRASDGNTTIVRPTADGSGWAQPTWSTKCQTGAGVSVNGKINAQAPDNHTASRVQISHGAGTVDVGANTADIAWDGSFTVVYYGGFTYWTASDPRLVVEPDGTGTVTATLSGYGTDMDDPSRWVPLAPRDVVIADLSGVEVTAEGLTATPEYLGVGVPADISGRNPADTAQPWSGAFPADFLRFQVLTGQGSYWYTTAGTAASIQPRKVALPLQVTVGASAPVPTAPEIGAHPQSAETTSRLPAEFTVEASGSGVSYAWQTRTGPDAAWTPIDAATDATLRLTATRALDGHQYRAVVTNDLGSVASDAATLTVGAKRPGSIVPPFADIATLDAAAGRGEVREGTSTTTGLGEGLDPDATLSASLPWSAAVVRDGDTTAEVWLYPGRAYLGEFAVAAGTASFAHTLDAAPAGSYRLLFVVDGQQPVSAAFSVAGRTAAAGAILRWGINVESNGGAFFGGCNFLSAGTAGDSGSPRVWGPGDVGSLYRAEDGDVRIEKPNAQGQWQTASFDDRCRMQNGRSPSTASTTDTTNAQVVMSGGTGEVDAEAGTARIAWSGSFTVAFYGGMTYWSASDPVLTVQDGVGTLTATGSGFGSDMDDLTKWAPLEPRQITLATLRGVELTGAGFTVTPDYLGVAIDGAGGRSTQIPQTGSNLLYWGSFPQDFVDFQVDTGQSAYWYTSGGARDRAKTPTPVTVCFTETCTVETPEEPAASPAAAIAQSALRPPRAMAPPPAPLPPAATANSAEEVVVVIAQAAPTGTAAPAAAGDRNVLVAAIALLGGLGVLAIVAAAGGILFATGTLGGGAAPPAVRPAAAPPG